MKKILFLLLFLKFSHGYSQDILTTGGYNGSASATSLTGVVPIVNGGTNASTAAGSLANLLNGQILLGHGGSVTCFSPSSNTNAARGAAIQAAFAASVSGDAISVFQGTYNLTSALSLKDSVVVNMEGVVINNYSNTGHIFEAINVSGWSIKGTWTLIGKGPNTGGSVSDECGIYIHTTSGYTSDWSVRGGTFKNFKGCAIFSDGNSGVTYYDKGGSVSECFIMNSNYGIYINAPNPGGGPDYNIFNNNHIHNNNIGINILSGNCSITNSTITNNNSGIYLQAGYNNSHGIISGNSINHNQVYGIYCDQIINGETIIGNHILENYSAGIYLNDCNGVNIIGGQIHSHYPAYAIVMNGSFTNKYNYLRNIWTNTIGGNDNALNFNATSDQLTHLIVTDCSTDLLPDATCNNGITLAGDVTTSSMTTTKTYTATLTNSGVAAGSYGDYRTSPSLVVDTKGRLTSASSSYISELNYPTAVQLATGGNISYSGGYTIHTFTSSATFAPSTNLTVDYLIVAGGGAGGSYFGGGGGGGGVLTGTASITPGNYSIVVGAGGAASLSHAGGNGGISAFYTYTATGGGGGGAAGSDPKAASNGGSGGGAGGGSASTSVGTGIGGQGTNGGSGNAGSSPYSSGGGGGAGGVGASSSGSNSGAGGVGISSSITGTSIMYGGGGGGSSTTYGANAASGGSGGGGAGGGDTGSGTGTSGTNGLGGGGGGSGNAAGGPAAGDGGSGIVVIRYLTSSSNRNKFVVDSTLSFFNNSNEKILKVETSGNIILNKTATTYTASANVTPYELTKGLLTISSGTCTLTLPTGTSLGNSIAAKEGTTFNFSVLNISAGGTATIVGNTNSVLVGDGTVLNNSTSGIQLFNVTFISPTAYVIKKEN